MLTRLCLALENDDYRKCEQSTRMGDSDAPSEQNIVSCCMKTEFPPSIATLLKGR